MRTYRGDRRRTDGSHADLTRAARPISRDRSPNGCCLFIVTFTGRRLPDGWSFLWSPRHHMRRSRVQRGRWSCSGRRQPARPDRRWGGTRARSPRSLRRRSPPRRSRCPLLRTADRSGRSGGAGSSALGFAAVPTSEADDVVVPPGYVAQVLIPWGDPVSAGGPAFEFDASNTAAEQAMQFGQGHDGMTFFHMSRNRGLLAINHEALDSPVSLFQRAADYTDPETVLKAQHAHGVSITELEFRGGRWSVARSRLARRIHANTQMELTGPAAGHPLLVTAADPSGRRVLGTFNNCANGATPWGTYLTCEENFNNYFGTTRSPFTPTTLMARYGIGAAGRQPVVSSRPPVRSRRQPERVEPLRLGRRDRPGRPRLGPQEAHRARPPEARERRLRRVRRRSCGRLHGRRRALPVPVQVRVDPAVAAVPARRQPARRRHPVRRPLRGRRHAVSGCHSSQAWCPGTPASATSSSTPAAPLRQSARRRWTVRSGSPRTPSSPASPTAPSPTTRTGSRRTRPTRGSTTPSATSCAGRAPAATTAPTRSCGRCSSSPATVSAPATVRRSHPVTPSAHRTASPSTPTDACGSRPTAAQPVPCNNQMLAADPVTGDIRRFLVGPKGCEITGWTMTEDQRTMFVNVQHPGEGATDPANPASQSNWPDRIGRPRSATLAIRRRRRRQGRHLTVLTEAEPRPWPDALSAGAVVGGNAIDERSHLVERERRGLVDEEEEGASVDHGDRGRRPPRSRDETRPFP